MLRSRQALDKQFKILMNCMESVLHLRSIRVEFVASAAFHVPEDFLSGYNAAVSNLRQLLWDSEPH